MTGAHFRVKRGDEFQAVEVEYLTDQERAELLGNRTPAELLRWLAITSRAAAELETAFDWLEQNPDAIQRSIEDDEDGLCWGVEITPGRWGWYGSILAAVNAAKSRG